MRQRLLSVLLASLMVLSLAGCGGDGKEADGGKPSDPPKTTESKDDTAGATTAPGNSEPTGQVKSNSGQVDLAGFVDYVVQQDDFEVATRDGVIIEKVVSTVVILADGSVASDYYRCGYDTKGNGPVSNANLFRFDKNAGTYEDMIGKFKTDELDFTAPAMVGSAGVDRDAFLAFVELSGTVLVDRDETCQVKSSPESGNSAVFFQAQKVQHNQTAANSFSARSCKGE